MIVTISREYGSGGRLIGEMAAQMLGIAFYDRNLIDMVAHESGLSQGYISQWEERVSSPVIWGMASLKGNAMMSGMAAKNYYYNEDRMYAVQSKIIRAIADKEPCVIVGRCADDILRERADCLRVFVHADAAIRRNRIIQEYGVLPQDAEKVLKTTDKGRAAYYKKYADNVRWGDCRYYHLALDSGWLGLSGCAELIVRAVHGRQKEG